VIGVFLFFLPILLSSVFCCLIFYFYMSVVVGILSIYSFFLIFSVSVPFLVCVILLILALFTLLLQKNSADLNLFRGVPIVVALDMNIYSSPGHKSSIVFFPGLTTIKGIGWFGLTFCP
jgi:hypothetical protein